MPQDKHWKSHIRPTALARASHRCSECGVPEKTVGWWDEFGVFHVIDDPQMVSVMSKRKKGVRVNDLVNVIKIILFVRHLDHDKANNKPSNRSAELRSKPQSTLPALSSDALSPHQAKMRRINRRKKEMGSGQMAFEI